MADIVQIQSYDTRPFPKAERRRGALPAVVEAGVKQELFFLNSVYENVSAGVLTVVQAQEIMWMLENASTLLEDSVEVMSSEESNVLEEILESCVIENLPISGAGVLPKQIIYESEKDDSIYKELGWSRVFRESTDSLAAAMNRRMDYLENELHSYFESYGERGFEEVGSIIYLESSDPTSEMFLKDYLNTVTSAATITDRFSAEDGVAILSFLEACLLDEFTVAAMEPIVPLEEDDIITKNPEDDTIKHQKKFDLPENAQMTESAINTRLHEYGWYTMEAAVAYKNNITFDSISRKLFNNLGKLIKLSNPEDPNESFKRALNMKKTEYKFFFNDSSDPKVDDAVRAGILATGFKPIRENGKVVKYQMDKNPIAITVEFEGIQTGINISYTGNAVKESTMLDDGACAAPIISLESDNRMKDRLVAICESGSMEDMSMSETLRTIGDSSMYSQIQNIRNNWGEDSVISEACDALMSALEHGEDSIDDGEIVSALNVVKDVIFTETACEAVLDAVEFKQEMMEAASKEDIDPEIKPVIELLNRLGYKTKYSSAGHREERSKDDRDKDGVYYGKLYTTARITFDGNYKFDKLPKGWYQNFNSDKTGIYVKPFTYNEKDGSPDEAFAKWRSEYIANLKDWAESLEETKDADMEKNCGYYDRSRFF